MSYEWRCDRCKVMVRNEGWREKAGFYEVGPIPATDSPRWEVKLTAEARLWGGENGDHCFVTVQICRTCLISLLENAGQRDDEPPGDY